MTNPLTASLNITVKLMSSPFVGSDWPTAWLIVTAGGVASKVTWLSELVLAAFPLPAGSLATPAARLAITVPSLLVPLTATL